MIRVVSFRPKIKYRPIISTNIEWLNIPVTKIIKMPVDIHRFLQKLGYVDYIVFTSTLTITFMQNALGTTEFYNYLKHCKEVIAVGMHTANALDISTVHVPSSFTTRGIGEYLLNKPQGTVLVVRSKEGTPELTDMLKSKMNVYVLHIYQSLILRPDEQHKFLVALLKAHKVDALVFSSAFIVRACVEVFSNIDNEFLHMLSSVFKVAIGIPTKNTMAMYNINADVVLKTPDFNEVIAVIKQKFGIN